MATLGCGIAGALKAGPWEILFHNVGHEQCTKHDANSRYANLVPLDMSIQRYDNV
jgi:hypothetical protein